MKPGSILLLTGAMAVALMGSAPVASARSQELAVSVTPVFNGQTLVFDSLTQTIGAGRKISVTRLDFLLSNVALRRGDGVWIGQTNWFAYIGGREGRTRFSLSNIPNGQYDRIRFNVGVEPSINHSDAAGYPAGHPLNPDVNGLHWGWTGGYVFLALEGHWIDAKPGSAGILPADSDARRQDAGAPRPGGYSYHLATDRQLMTIELPVALDLSTDADLRVALNVEKIFGALPIDDTTASTHSRTNDSFADQLRTNVETAFAVVGVHALARQEEASPNTLKRELQLVTGTPYRLTISKFFPRPSLPTDNPLTEEGVELGRQLFFDPRLSINNRQSCSSCHQARFGFGEHREVSVGAEGRIGTRNAMPLANLAWKSSYFWDGRAATLREQVLQPIQNPIEMHEALTNVVAKLQGRARLSERAVSVPISRGALGEMRPTIDGSDYPVLFARAFGTPEITADRMARALEQFLLTQVSFNSKFDRVLLGAEKFTAEEQRGFDLFHAEYDPRRGQYGADCFHCHGGPLFQSQAFANNGLDAAFADVGRYAVTKRAGDEGRFAVPSLRNVEFTAPYMHDGRFGTLEEAVAHYCTGMKRSATLDPNLAKHPDGGVPLAPAEQRALVAFLKTLTDEQFIRPTSSVGQIADRR